MGFRFYRRIKIAPGVSLNLGKKGASVSIGPRGAKMTFGKNGTRTSVGIPGTGMRYEKCYPNSSSGGGGGDVSCSFVMAIVFGVVAYLAYLLSKVEMSGACVLVMVASGIAALIAFFIWILTDRKSVV